MTTGSKNSIFAAFNGNQGGLDIRTASNYIVLSDGDGNPLITTADNQTVALEGAVPNSGTGITFPATQSASTNANTLDDYEEGTFTPNITTGITLPTYSQQLGTYTKIGNVVQIQISIVTTGGTRNAAHLVFGGLPFTAAAFSGGVGLAVAYANSGVVNSTSTNLPTMYVDQNQTTVGAYKTDGGTFIGNDLASSSFRLDFAGTYRV
jgi:hypothetical protein